MVELEVNTREQGEVLEYRVGPRYKYFDWRSTWSQAEDDCVGDGGHLASVSSNEEVGELDSVIPEVNSRGVWIGGKNRKIGNWSWVNGKQWGMTVGVLVLGLKTQTEGKINA